MRVLIQVRVRPGAAVDHRLEIAIADDRVGFRPHRAGKPPGNVEGIQRNDAAQFRLDPVKRRVVGTLRHGKDAAGIGLEQHFGGDVYVGGIAAGHGIAEIAMFAAGLQE
jgi:hypothetical protein